MIVDSMTYEEVIDLFKIDCAILQHKINENTKRFQKAVKESRKIGKRYFKPITFSGSRGFNYVLQFFDYGIDVPSKKRLGLYYYAWFRKNKGIYALSFTKLGGCIWHFTVYHPHFFDRYRERFLKHPQNHSRSHRFRSPIRHSRLNNSQIAAIFPSNFSQIPANRRLRAHPFRIKN